MSAEGLDMDAIRAEHHRLIPVNFPDQGYDWRTPVMALMENIPALLDHVRALEQENAGLRGEVERLRTRRGDCICDYSPETTDGPSEDCPQHGRPYAEWVERSDAARAALDGLRAAITVVIGPEGDEWRWSDSNLRGLLRAVLGEHGGTS